MEKKLKYNPSDYPEFSDFLEDIEDKYAKYLEKKDEISKIYLKQAIGNLKSAIKAAVGLNTMTKEEGEEMLEYYWGLVYD